MFFQSYRHLAPREPEIVLAQKIFPDRRKDVDQNYFLVQHSRTMPGARREMEHVTGLSNALLVADSEEGPATFDQGHLFVGMIVGRRDDVRRQPQPADHDVLADNHLPLDAFL